ncbi:MAG: TetR/AcrR family transcriptional regulator [Pseudomonadota bacterium]
MPDDTLDETAKQILKAASRRFLHYGYGKTTMSEIAKDCNMSTGNLYRYFPSKLDIAEMFVRVLRRDQLAQLRDIADTSGVTPADKLRAFLVAKFQLAYERFHDKPKAFELSSSLLSERPKIAVEWEEMERQVLAGILREGDQIDAFAIDDPDAIAKTLLDAAYRFTSAAVFHEGEFGALEAELQGIVDLALDGFAWRKAKKHQMAPVA